MKHLGACVMKCPPGTHPDLDKNTCRGCDGPCPKSEYCKFGNFRVTFISRIFYLRIISEFLNSRVSVHVLYRVYSDSLLARTLNSRGNQFANISEN